MRARVLAVMLTLAACGASQRAPAWPKSAGVMAGLDDQEDGGESLAPREHDGAAAALEAAPDLSVAAILDDIDLEPTVDVDVPTEAAATPEPIVETGEVIELEVQEITIEDESVRP